MPEKTTKERYNDLYKSLKAKLTESGQEKTREYFELVAVSDKPAVENKDFCPNKFGMEARKQLEALNLYEKYEELKKAFEQDSNNDAKKDYQDNAKEALNKFIHEDLKRNSEFANKFEGQFKAVQEAEDEISAEEKRIQGEIDKLDAQLKELNGKEVDDSERAAHNTEKQKVEEELNRLKTLEADKAKLEKLDKAKNGLFDAVIEKFVKAELEITDLADHIKNARQYKALRAWDSSDGRPKREKFCGKEASDLLGELEKLNDFIVKLGEEKEDAKEEDLNELQNLEQEINSYLSAKAEDKDSASKDKDTKPSFSERVKSSFETAMNYLKKNQKTLRNIAGGLLATVFIYNIAAIIAGFNAFALMASIATLTSTLPLVLASAEIALIAFAGTSLIAYTATNDKVRKACSIEGLKEPKIKPEGSSTPEAGKTPTNGG
jgi:hypothetical protein